MSLVIASNLPNEDESVGTESSIYKPFSFRNDMSSTMKIPPNAQIALQSAKVHLSDSIIFSEDNKKFYIYFGQGVRPPTTAFNTLNSMEGGTAVPIPCHMIFNENKSEGTTFAANREEFAILIQRTINQNVGNPQFVNRCSVFQSPLVADPNKQGFKVEYNGTILPLNTGDVSGTGNDPDQDFIPNSYVPRTDTEVAAYFRGQRYSAITPAFPVEELAQPWGTRPSQRAGKGIVWDYTYDVANDVGVFETLLARNRSQAITFNVPPLSNINGRCTFITSAGGIYGRDAGNSAKWAVGLSRPAQKNLSTTGRANINPPYYQHRNGSKFVYFLPNYWDFCVWVDNLTNANVSGGFSVDGQINVGQCVVDTSDVVAGQARLNHLPKFMSMPYWELDASQTDFRNPGGPGVNVYAPIGPQANPPAADNGQLFATEFRLNGEIMEIWIMDGGPLGNGVGGKYYKLMGHAKGEPALNNLKPVSQDCWNLQPVMSINNQGLNGGAELKQIGLSQYTSCNPNYATLTPEDQNGSRNGDIGWVSGRGSVPADYNTIIGGGWLEPLKPGGYESWEQKCVRENFGYKVAELMGQPAINRGSEFYTLVPLNSNAYVYGGVEASDPALPLASLTYDIQRPVLILQESNRYTPSEGAGLQTQLGFVGEPVAELVRAGTSGYYEVTSITEPVFKSSKSIFVRIGNLTQTSVNMRAGIAGSKIIAHLPRFVQQKDSASGPLYLEPNNLIYCDLNNPNELNISNLELSLCYVDETLATSVIGTTILCFHVRQKP